jgi:chromosome segregation ATPase
MAVDMNQIKGAIAALDANAKLYEAFAGAKDALILIGKLEAERVSLSKAADAARKEAESAKAFFDVVKAELEAEKTKTIAKIAEEVATTEVAASERVSQLVADHANRKTGIEAELSDLSVRLKAAKEEVDRVGAEASASKDVLESTRKAIAVEEKRLSDVKERIAKLKAGL